MLERLSPPGQRAFRFLTSIDYFHAGDAGLAGRDDVVPYQSGCILNQEKPVAELVRSPLEGAARLAPGQTTREWVQANATGEPYAIDVIGGGFPDLFRHAGGWHEPRLEPLPPAKADAAEPEAASPRD